MSIHTHLALLAVAVLLPLVAAAVNFRLASQSSGETIRFTAPFFVLGLLCLLVLSMNGIPFLEWLLPGMAVLVSGFCCRSRPAFRMVSIVTLGLSVFLCDSFLTIVQSQRYTAAPGKIAYIAATNERAAIKQAAKSLPEKPGPIGSTSKVEITPEWHTPFTRIHRVKRSTAVLWYDGTGIVVRPAI